MRHTEELLDQAVRVATRLGYRVQLDWLEGCGGGKCTAAGDEWIFLDRGLPPQEQLSQITSLLQNDTRIYGLGLSLQMQSALGLRKSA